VTSNNTPDATPKSLTPEVVSAILRDPDSPYYPTQITVFCDHCGVRNTGDYMVREDMSSEQRLAVARKHLVDNEGWEHTGDGDDFCPDHAGSTAEEQPADRQLPHDPYITAVADALTAAGLEPDNWWTSDGETRGLYCYLNAVIDLDTDSSGLDEERFPNGLVLIWEWHTGIEEGEPERGPSWQWAAGVDSHGQTEQPEPLTAEGYASPEYVVDSVRALVEHRNQSMPAARWGRAGELESACEAWGADETDE
jgi:hypothetical protein